MTIARLSLAAVLAFAIAGTGVTFLPRPAHAGGGDKAAAKKAFKKGKKLYKDGDYKGALPMLLEANRLDPNPALVKAIIKTYEKMENVPKAAAFLQGVLDAQRPAKAIKWAEKKLTSYKGVLDELKAAEMAEAKKKAGAEAKAQAEAEAAKREAEVKAQQDEEDKKRAEEEARRREEHEKKRKSAIEANKLADERAGSKRIIAYGAGGLSLAAIGTGVVFGLQALTARDEANKCAKAADTTKAGTCAETTYEGHVDDNKKAALLADVSWIAAGLGGVGAAVFYLMAESEKSSAPAIPPPYDELGTDDTDDEAAGAPAEEGGGDDAGDPGNKGDKEPKPESKPESKDDGADTTFFVGPTGLLGWVGTF